MDYLRNILHLCRWLVKDPKQLFTRKERLDHLYSALRRLRIALGLLLFSLLVGTIGYKCLAHVSWFDAYYMSLVTLSTVGFGEVIPLDHLGRVFTSYLILFNIGFFAFSISTFTSIFADADLHSFFLDFNMMQRIKTLEDHTIVCGYGRHATEVCQELNKGKMPFVVLESDAAKIDILRHETDYMFIQGDATSDEVLEAAGIEKASALVLTLPSDANNLFVVLSARQVNPKLKIISRLNDGADEQKLRRAGADHVVIPERIGGFYMATLVSKPDLVEFFNLISNMGSTKVVFEEIPVARLKEQFQRRSIAGSAIQELTQVPIVGLRYPDGHYELNPSPQTSLHPDMHIVVLSDQARFRQFTQIVLQQETGSGASRKRRFLS